MNLKSFLDLTKVAGLLKNIFSEYKVVILTIFVILLSSGFLFQMCETKRVNNELEKRTAQFEKDKKVLTEGYNQIISDIKKIEKEYQEKLDKIRKDFEFERAVLEENIKKDIETLSKDMVKMSDILKLLGFEDVTP